MVNNDDDILIFIPSSGRRAESVDDDKFLWASLQEQRQMALMLHCSSLLDTLLTAANHRVDVVVRLGSVVFQSHLVVHSAMFEVFTQRWITGQVQKTGLV